MPLEILRVVDESNNPTKVARNIHYVHEHGLWHRTAHVWLYNKKGEILFQKRSMKCFNHPGFFDISAAGHIPINENYEETAKRELFEELGIRQNDAKLEAKGVLSVCHRFVVRRKARINREFAQVYLCQYDKSAQSLNLQKEEVEEVRFFKIPWLKKVLFLNIEHEKKKFVPHKDEYYKTIIDYVEQAISDNMKK